MKISLVYVRTTCAMFFFCGIAIVTVVSNRFMQSLFVVDKYEFAIHGVSTEYTMRIQQEVYNCFVRQRLDARTTIAYIKKMFPAIDTVTFLFQPDCIFSTISTHIPMCIIDDEKVFIDTGMLVDSAFFDNLQLKSTPRITIVKNRDQFVADIPRLIHSLCENFSFFDPVVVEDTNSVYLHDKQEARFVIVSTVDITITEKIMHHCQRIKQQLYERGAFKKNDQWIADIRFADHIIVYRGGYGTNCK